MPLLPPRDLDPALSGWPGRLCAALSGSFDAVAALAQVEEAVRLERRAAARAVEVRVDQVEPVTDPTVEPDEPALWALQVAWSSGAPPVRDWSGAVLACELADGGPPWRAEVVEGAPGAHRVVVLGPLDAPPRPGPARVFPFDFLRAAHDLVTSPRLAGARPAYGRLLGATLGELEAPGPLTGRVGNGTHGHRAWTSPWAMVWGPPGTGKTHTVVEEVARILVDPDERVLVVSTTNKATDEVALRLGPGPGGVLRVGTLRVGAFRSAGLLDLLPRPTARLQLLETLEARRESARTSRQRAIATVALDQARRGLPRLNDLLAEQAPRCVLTTGHAALSAVVSPEMEPFFLHGRAPFTTVVIDEAGLVPRTSAAAIALLAARQVVLVGDPRQLSPICVAARSLAPPVKRWLALSAMEHADPRQPGTQALMRQRRMHPEISGVVSLFQYGGLLDDHPTVRDRPLPDALAGRLAGWPRAAWIVLDQCEGQDPTTVAAERTTDGSWARPAGAEVLRLMLERYPELGRLRGLFISPYRAQARAVGAVIEALGLSQRWSASTVHAQQGAEADVVVFDLVRHGGWPLPEWKRLVNVALSRARFQLLVLAAEQELAHQPGCSALFERLVRCSVGPEGSLRVHQAPDAQQLMFGGLATTVDSPGGPAGDPPPTTGAAPRERPPPPGDPSDLGVQIFHSRAARRSMTRYQAQLVRRDLKDLGPRVVRGVAGSGKTIVLARWVALELVRHQDRDVTVVFGNTALRQHLEALIEQAWRVTVAARGAEPPWGRVNLVHVGTLLGDLMDEARLPRPPRGGTAEYDYESQARSLREAALAPRFGLLYLDEAQDLGHETLALLVSLVIPARDPDDQTRSWTPIRIFYDNAQNVYRRSTPRWAEFGLDVRGRSAVLRESFRTTRASMELALDIVDALRPLEEDPDMHELIAPRSGPPVLVREASGGWRADFCVEQGQTPQVALHDSQDDELAALVGVVRNWLDQAVAPRDIRVLAPRRRRCDQLASALQANGIDAVALRNTAFQNSDPRVVVTTPQSFKGYEAELVAVVGVEEFVTRSEGKVLVEALYVALTRARTWMWVSGVRVPQHEVGARVVAAVEAAAARRRR